MLGQSNGTSGMLLSGERGTAKGLGRITLRAGDGGRSGVYAPRVPLVEARGQVLNVVVACRIGAVSGLLCLKVLVVLHFFVAEHDFAQRSRNDVRPFWVVWRVDERRTPWMTRKGCWSNHAAVRPRRWMACRLPNQCDNGRLVRQLFR